MAMPSVFITLMVRVLMIAAMMAVLLPITTKVSITGIAYKDVCLVKTSVTSLAKVQDKIY